MSKRNPTPGDVIFKIEQSNYPSYTGRKCPDLNFPGNFLLIESVERIYSFHYADVIKEEKIANGLVKITMGPNCMGMFIQPYLVPKCHPCVLPNYENMIPPKVIIKKGDPTFASSEDYKKLKASRPRERTIASAAMNFETPKGTCVLGKTPSENNCTHYLSDAFIKAGFDELRRERSEGGGIFYHWCDTITPPRRVNINARPIRAKEMNQWFLSIHTELKTTLPDGEGFWAVFQFDAAEYAGGHVLIYDSDSRKVYGTGVYWDWKEQYFYKW